MEEEKKVLELLFLENHRNFRLPYPDHAEQFSWLLRSSSKNTEREGV